MPWILLLVAGLLEAVWAIGLKHTDGFSRLWPSVGTIAAMLVSFILLARAMQSLPLGLAYTVWVGIGAVGAIVGGAWFFGERLTPAQFACIVLIGVGIVGLKATQGGGAGVAAA
ncbi:MAG: multidrug efflux SMR transporter [Phycisphaerae bacterium]|nr:multidrug efflux SMR transporter [Phycisphaerae bacterium]